ncbi:MAG: hypothetical protein COA33_002865 [Fluviicola sp.]|nr:hypothetical protein [Fluviicola sp.]
MKLLFLISTLALLFSCGNSKKAAEKVVDTSTSSETVEETTPTTTKPQRNAMVKATIGSFKDSDDFDVHEVSINGNTLLLTISYSGGCADHKFEFIGNSVVMKSIPPIRSVRLIHDAAGDACESVVTRIIEVDLKNIAYTPTAGSELILMLKGWDTKIKYTYE